MEVFIITPRKPIDQQMERKDILNVARDLFVENGFRDVSMRKIATKLGVSHGAIYYHFKNKASLFYSIVDKDFALLDQEVDKTLTMEGGKREKLKELFIAYIRFGIKHSNHYEIMFLIQDEELNKLMNREPNESYEKFAKAVYQLGDKDTITLQKIWSSFLSLHGFVTHYIKSDQSFEDIEGLAYSHAEFILTSLEK